MSQNKLRSNVERARHLHAFEVYRDLGYGRSYRETARQVGATADSVSKWARIYKWEERLHKHGVAVAEMKEKGELLRVDDPIVQKLLNLMGNAEALIDSAFIKDRVTGKPSPKIKIDSIEDLTKCIAEYRKLLETYNKSVAAFRPPAKEKDRNVSIKEFNVNMGNMSQEERIKVMEALKNGDVSTGDKQSSRRVQDADFTEVSGRGDENGPGRNGVLGSPASGSSGNEKDVRGP